MRVLLNRVPYYFTSPEATDVWRDGIREKASTLACLKMAMEYVKRPGTEIPRINILFEESELIQQNLLHKELITEKMLSRGRMHSSIVWVAHNHGIPAHMEEFKSVKIDVPFDGFLKSPYEGLMLKVGYERICQSIVNNSPVIVSVGPMIGEKRTEPHSILIVGFERDKDFIHGFFFHNPDNSDIYPSSEEFVALVEFENCWRRIAIFVDSFPK